MYVVQVLTNTVFGVGGTATSDYQVSSSTRRDLARNMAREDEMTLGPLHRNLLGP